MGSTFFRRWIGGFLAVCLTLTGMPALCVSGAEPAVSAQSCILMEAVTGEILYEKQAQEQRPMASTTKIMTTLLCLESGDLDTEFPVDTDAIHVEGSSMGLVEGDIVTKRALCYGMLLPSGNDAAGAAAVKLAGNYAAFSEQMNQKAAELGMTQTHFVTPSGLHDDQHYSTAYDMALLTAAAMQNETFREICRQPSAKVCFGNSPYERWLTNSNKLLTMDETVVGVKTGFTDEAGRCLVSACVRNGIMLICVTLNDRDDWQDHERLYDYGFGQLTPTEVSFPTDWSIAVAGGTAQQVTLIPEGTIVAGTRDGKAPALEFQLETAPFLYAPVTAGQDAGTWKALCGGRVAAQGRLCAGESAVYQKKSAAPQQQSRQGGIVDVAALLAAGHLDLTEIHQRHVVFCRAEKGTGPEFFPHGLLVQGPDVVPELGVGGLGGCRFRLHIHGAEILGQNGQRPGKGLAVDGNVDRVPACRSVVGGGDVGAPAAAQPDALNAAQVGLHGGSGLAGQAGDGKRRYTALLQPLGGKGDFRAGLQGEPEGVAVPARGLGRVLHAQVLADGTGGSALKLGSKIVLRQPPDRQLCLVIPVGREEKVLVLRG